MELSAAILERHHLIADKFYTGQGLRLQKINSDIAEYVMLQFAKYNMPILPLHDSFIIRSGYEESLEKMIQEAFHQIVGSNIEIKEKKTVHPDRMLEAERAVWSKVQLQKDDMTPVTEDIYELLAYMETGYQKRLSIFLDLGSNGWQLFDWSICFHVWNPTVMMSIAGRGAMTVPCLFAVV